MTPKGSFPLNLDERLVIEKMLKDGAKTGTIASTLCRSHSCIKQEIRKMGGRALYDGKKSQERAEEINRAKIRKTTKGFTEAQKTIIDQLIEAKEPIFRISQIAGVTPARVSTYISNLGIAYPKNNAISLRQRLESIEQQLEILFELIKEKK